MMWSQLKLKFSFFTFKSAQNASIFSIKANFERGLLIVFSISLLFILLLFPLIKLSLPLASIDSFRERFVNTQLEREAAKRLNQNVLDYLQSREKLDEAFTKLEREHMEDVKHLFSIGETLFSLALTMALISSITLYGLRRQGALLRASGRVGLSVMLLGFIVVIALLVDFQNLFVYFHIWLFPQGNWSFSPHSFLIQLYPRPFFLAMGLTLFLISMAMSLTMWFFGLAMRRKLFKSFQTLF